MRELLIATKNQGKLKEIRFLLKDLPYKITSLAEYPNLPEIVEDGKTFYANAVKKAVVIAKHTGKLTMGEDSGLEVKALGNKPGVFSARFSGAHATDEKNNDKLLAMLAGVPAAKRQARYQCCAALADKSGVIAVVSGSCGGIITTSRQGTNGFGYDPLFFIKRYNGTFGQLPAEVKSRISHRARALKKIREVLKELSVG
jgi:XTP/dITP diphosphohydrolase